MEFWLTEGLNDDGFAAVMDAFPDIVAPHHAERADMLLWRWRASDASRLLPYLDEDEAALVRARIALIRNAGNAAALVEAVPASRADHPGLAYDRFNRLADRGDWTDAVALLMQQSTSDEALGVPWRWASWRRTLAAGKCAKAARNRPMRWPPATF